MCIICQMREAGASEEALKIANDLAEVAVVAANELFETTATVYRINKNSMLEARRSFEVVVL